MNGTEQLRGRDRADLDRQTRLRKLAEIRERTRKALAKFPHEFRILDRQITREERLLRTA